MMSAHLAMMLSARSATLVSGFRPFSRILRTGAEGGAKTRTAQHSTECTSNTTQNRRLSAGGGCAAQGTWRPGPATLGGRVVVVGRGGRRAPFLVRLLLELDQLADIVVGLGFLCVVDHEGELGGVGCAGGRVRKRPVDGR